MKRFATLVFGLFFCLSAVGFVTRGAFAQSDSMVELRATKEWQDNWNKTHKTNKRDALCFTESDEVDDYYGERIPSCNKPLESIAYHLIGSKFSEPCSPHIDQSRSLPKKGVDSVEWYDAGNTYQLEIYMCDFDEYIGIGFSKTNPPKVIDKAGRFPTNAGGVYMISDNVLQELNQVVGNFRELYM